MFGLGTGFDCYIMNSDFEATRFINEFRKLYEPGDDPNEVEQRVYESAGIDPDCFTEGDRRRIEREICEIIY